MNRALKVILIVFFIFLINTASAKYQSVSITAAPGEEISRTISFTGGYGRLFASADASGYAASWVTPRRVDFGAIDPDDTIEREYTINVPKYQNPGTYELIWKWSCKYTDGSACKPIDDYLSIQITVKGMPEPTAAKDKYTSLTLTSGEELSDYLEFSAPYGSSYAWADASGEAASWVTPRHIDFGVVNKGESATRYYTINVPEYQYSGYYEIIWKWGCKYVSGETCSVAGDTVLQITVEEKPEPIYTKPIPGFTPAMVDDSAGPIIIGLIFILVLFIIWIYVVVWVARDANKRGSSGTLWGIVAFFLGLLGVLIYLIARPKGTIVFCEHCGKEKLETLTRCPHCKKTITSAMPTPMPAPYPAAARKPQEAKDELSADELKDLKEKLRKTNQLLDKLDERLAQGEITEAKYKQLAEKYKAEADGLKNLIAEKELLDEVGLKDE